MLENRNPRHVVLYSFLLGLGAVRCTLGEFILQLQRKAQGTLKLKMANDIIISITQSGQTMEAKLQGADAESMYMKNLAGSLRTILTDEDPATTYAFLTWQYVDGYSLRDGKYTARVYPGRGETLVALFAMFFADMAGKGRFTFEVDLGALVVDIRISLVAIRTVQATVDGELDKILTALLNAAM